MRYLCSTRAMCGGTLTFDPVRERSGIIDAAALSVIACHLVMRRLAGGDECARDLGPLRVRRDEGGAALVVAYADVFFHCAAHLGGRDCGQVDRVIAAVRKRDVVVRDEIVGPIELRGAVQNEHGLVYVDAVRKLVDVLLTVRMEDVLAGPNPERNAGLSIPKADLQAADESLTCVAGIETLDRAVRLEYDRAFR